MIPCRKLASIQLHISLRPDIDALALLSKEIISILLRDSRIFLRWKSLKEICLIQFSFDFKFMTLAFSFCERIFHISMTRQTHYNSHKKVSKLSSSLPFFCFLLSAVKKYHKSRISNTMQNKQQSATILLPAIDENYDEMFLWSRIKAKHLQCSLKVNAMLLSWNIPRDPSRKGSRGPHHSQPISEKMMPLKTIASYNKSLSRLMGISVYDFSIKIAQESKLNVFVKRLCNSSKT